MKRYIPLIVLVGIFFLYIFYSTSILKLGDLGHFSLIDDGQSFLNSEIIDNCIAKKDCSMISSVVFEKDFGRFRPLYWFLQWAVGSVFGNNAVSHHLFRGIFIGGMLLITMFVFLNRIKTKTIGIIFSVSIFFPSIVFAENIVRLGPVETWQLLFITFFTLLFTYSQKKEKVSIFIEILIYILSFLLSTIKETSIAIIVPIIISSIIYKKVNRISIFSTLIILLSVLIGKAITSIGPASIPYSENYNLSLSNIKIYYENSLKYYRLFVLNIPIIFNLFWYILPLSAIINKIRKNIYQYDFVFLCLIFLSFVGILIPWKFVLDRYLFIPLFFLSIIIGKVFGEIFKFIIEKISTNVSTGISIFASVIVISSVISSSSIANYVKSYNYSKWFKEFTLFEHDQVEAISKTNSDTIYLNLTESIDNWEIIFEYPLHLKYFYPDTKKNIVLLRETKKINSPITLFSRSSSVPVIPQTEILSKYIYSKVFLQKKYYVDQIDIEKFMKEYYRHPLKVIFYPPITTGRYEYSWEIREFI